MPLSPARRFAEIATSHRPTDTRVLMGRAVVLGASMAGLLAARVLSDHAEQVLIVERDESDTGTGPRPGVPQGSQVHALLPAGQAQLERWLPGITGRAMAAGAVPPAAEHVQMYINGTRRPLPPPAPVAGPALITTRPFLEDLVRRATLALPNVRLVHARAEGLQLDAGRVTGVALRDQDSELTEPAELVVDAMGRSSRLGDWLGAHGWPAPPMQRMPIRLNYATAMFARDEAISGVRAAVAQWDSSGGGTARQGGINAVENDRWIMLVAGYGDDRPTRDVADFTTRCRRDFPAVFGDIAEGARMLGDVVTYHQADSRRRDFHAVRRLPAGLVATGDAVASFNPVYGQGMTSAALHASCLSAYLRSGPSLQEPARDYFDRVRVVVDAAWQVSTLADLSLPHVPGPYPPGYRFTSWFGGRLSDAAVTDPELNSRLGAVTTMTAHPMSLMRPTTVLRVVGHRPGIGPPRIRLRSPRRRCSVDDRR